MLAMDICIRPMRAEDLDDIIMIEQESFPNPWTAEMFGQEFLWGSSFLIVSFSKTAYQKDYIAGYGVYRKIDTCAEIMNLCVRERCKRMHVGTRLLEYMIADIQRGYVKNIYLEVRPENLPALALYAKHGFTFNRMRKNYYRDHTDAYEMVKKGAVDI